MLYSLLSKQNVSVFPLTWESLKKNTKQQQLNPFIPSFPFVFFFLFPPHVHTKNQSFYIHSLMYTQSATAIERTSVECHKRKWVAHCHYHEQIVFNRFHYGLLVVLPRAPFFLLCTTMMTMGKFIHKSHGCVCPVLFYFNPSRPKGFVSVQIYKDILILWINGSLLCASTLMDFAAGAWSFCCNCGWLWRIVGIFLFFIVVFYLEIGGNFEVLKHSLETLLFMKKRYFQKFTIKMQFSFLFLHKNV